MSHNFRLMVFSGSANLDLGQEIAQYIGIELGKIKLHRFSDGEIYVRYLESVRGADVFVIQSLCAPINENLMELLIMIDALKRASAERISAVIPYYGYARQDKKTLAREPITAKLVADVLSVAGIDRMISMDIHAGQTQGFFDVPVDHLTAVPILADYFQEKRLENLVVVSPDVGRVKTAKRYSDRLNADIAILHKTRPAHNVSETTHVIGKVKGKVTLLIDDIIDTAGTMVGGAQTLKDHGATEIYACATHPVLSGSAVEKLGSSLIKEVVVTNTIPVPQKKRIKKFKVVSIAPLFAKTIVNVHEDKSVSELLGGDDQV
ncbi:MAG: ribose-phosphate pyrophosphokinase [Actinomycetota bacterium]|nr:ribose-phosphate pyrophosphokinase [Actinomycetota bacterium]MDI6822577.1 ribose-phosphate pyrophosphokinase [Actinomycetota bacterium]